MSKQSNLLSPVTIPQGKVGEWEIHKDTVPAGTVFNTANLRCSFFGQKNRKVSWPYPTTWTYLKEGGGTWMSDIPCEHAQMLNCIKGIRGKVLVGGLGLGLAATLLAKKKTVEQIIIVEKSQEVVELVWEHVATTKMAVVVTDLFEYLKCSSPNYFNYAFYDIWQSDGEGTFFNTVCPLYELSKGRIKHLPVCWNIDIMKGQLQLSLQTRLMWTNPKLVEALGRQPENLPKSWEEGGDIWHNWSVPFFKWWKKNQPSAEAVQQGASFYSQIYGTWDWERKWQLFQDWNI